MGEGGGVGGGRNGEILSAVMFQPRAGFSRKNRRKSNLAGPFSLGPSIRAGGVLAWCGRGYLIILATLALAGGKSAVVSGG